MHDVNNDDLFKGMTLEQIKEKIATKPKHIPDTVLDTAAMHAAIDRFQAEKQAKEIRDWLVYEAPPGVYDMYIEEKTRLEEQQKAQNKMSNRFAGTFLVCVASYLIYTMYTLFHMGYHQ